MAKKRTYGGSVTVDAVAVGGVNSISLSGVDVNMIPASAWDDDNGGWAEFIGGLKDGGNIEIGGMADDADTGQTKLITSMGTTVAVVVSWSDGRKITADCVIGGYNDDGSDEDGLLSFSATCKVTGAITRGAAV